MARDLLLDLVTMNTTLAPHLRSIFFGLIFALAGCAAGAPSEAALQKTGQPDGNDEKTGTQDPAGCGQVTAKGTCVNNGTVMRWCDKSNKLLESDCAADTGFTCKIIAGEAKCVDASSGGQKVPTSSEPGSSSGGTSSGCGEITELGICVNGGSVMRWCSGSSTLLETDCAYDTGYTCQMVSGEAKCVDTQASSGSGGSSSTGCGSVPAKGQCMNGGSIMKWCSNNTVYETDCAYDPGYTCKMISEEAKCVEISSSAPPPLHGIGSPCTTYRDCEYDLECPTPPAGQPKTCQCVQGACMDR